MAGLKYKILDHPSDLGIVAFGKDKKELFENAAYGMFSLMADMEKVAPKETIDIAAAGEDISSLLVNWLNELIYYEDAKKMLFCEFKISKLTATELKAQARGEKLDPQRHCLHRPLKAATYNQLQISGNQAKIVFDV